MSIHKRFCKAMLIDGSETFKVATDTTSRSGERKPEARRRGTDQRLQPPAIQFVAGQDGGGLNENLAGVNCVIFPDFGFTPDEEVKIFQILELKTDGVIEILQILRVKPDGPIKIFQILGVKTDDAKNMGLSRVMQSPLKVLHETIE
jgi:hypothetical protein